MKDMRTIQLLASISLIGGPLSLIIGGVFLSTAAFVCGIIALVMVRSSKGDATDEAPSDTILQTLTRQAVIGIAVSGIALVMNAAALMMMLPAILDAVQTGDYTSLLNGDASMSDSSSADSGGAFGGTSTDQGESASQGGRSSVWG